MAKWNIGKKLTKETKTKISISAKNSQNSGRFKKGMIGIQRGKTHWAWKGGITSLNKQIRCSSQMLQWRSDVFQRDNWTCGTCGVRGGDLESHHIKPLAKIVEEYNLKSLNQALQCEELWDINNGQTLCKECHRLTKLGSRTL